MIEDQLTGQIIGAAIEVHKHWGPGLYEEVADTLSPEKTSGEFIPPLRREEYAGSRSSLLRVFVSPW